MIETIDKRHGTQVTGDKSESLCLVTEKNGAVHENKCRQKSFTGQ